MTDDPQYIAQFLDSIFSHGTFWVYLVIVGACFIENILPPFPGDSFILAAGGLVAVSRLDFYLTFVLIVAAGVSSVMVMYVVGRRYGRSYFLRKDFKYFSAADILKVENYLNRWGGLILVCSRFIVGFRSAIAVGAGIGWYNARKMLLYSVMSYLLFAGLLMYLAMAVVDHYDLIAHTLSTYHKVLWPLVIALLILYIARRYRRLKKKAHIR
ncbi:MAG: DedA family protein [Candidatus Zixiibacteriota bacterium]